MTRLPRLAVLVLGRLLPASHREPLLGDLAEEYADRVESGGRVRAARWLWSQVLRSVVPAIELRFASPRVLLPVARKDSIMGRLLQDLRHALRLIRRGPGYALVVAGTLSLGIGASTVVFSVVDGVVLNPFPFPEPSRLVGVGSEFPRAGLELNFWENLSPAEYLDIRDGTRALRDVVAWDMGNRQASFGDVTDNLFTAFWWGDAFPTLGVQPVLGRGFTAEEIRRGDRVAILSHRVWETRFGGARDLVGGTVLVNGEPYTIVGIMPPRSLIYGTDLWLPMTVAPEVFPRARRQFQVLGRLAPGATLAQANTELAGLAARVAEDHAAALPEYRDWRLVAMTWADINVRFLKPAALVLTGAVAFVLLLVIANVANLVLARSTSRRREFALRAALGAGGGRLMQQLLTENVLLALCGGALGVGLGVLGVRGVVSALPSVSVPVPGEIAVNVRVLLFSTLVAVGSGLAFGLLPALRARRSDLQATLQEEGHGSTGGSRLRLQRVFVGVEVALALVLLVGGGLLMRSFMRLQAVEPGFQTENVLTMRLTLPRERYSEDRIEPFFRELVRRVEEIPGVAHAATATQFPPGVFQQRRVWIEGAEPADEGTLPTAYTTLVSPGFFEALGIPLMRGRLLSEDDLPGAPIVAVINEVAARRFFPDRDPVGGRFRLSEPESGGPWVMVVGVVGSTRNRGLDSPAEPEVFASMRQVPGGNQFFLLTRTRVDARSVLPDVRAVVRGLDAQQPVYAIQTVREAYAARASTRRLSTLLLSIFGTLALLLAALGIYAVVSYAVSQRTREIGLRMALGAGQPDVRRLVLRQALLPVLVGATVGLAGAIALGRAMTGLLFEVSGVDLVTLASVTAVLLGSALLATYIPARRASRLDPLGALRFEQSGH